MVRVSVLPDICVSTEIRKEMRRKRSEEIHAHQALEEGVKTEVRGKLTFTFEFTFYDNVTMSYLVHF